MKRKTAIIILGVVFSIVFLYLAVRQIDWSQFLDAYRQANYWWLIPAAFVYVGGYLLRGLRWQVILSPVKKCRYLNTLSALMIGFMANNLLPLRIGEFVRAYLHGTREKLPKTSSFATILVERTFDLFALVVIFLLATLIMPVPFWVKRIAIIIAIILALIIAFYYGMLFRREQTEKLVRNILFFLPKRATDNVAKLVSPFISGLEVMLVKRELLTTVGLSIGIWLAEAMTCWILLYGFFPEVYLPFGAAMLVITIVSFGVILPSSPGFVGIFESFTVMALLLLGIEKGPALSFAVLTHVLQFGMTVVAGLGFMWRENLALAQIVKQAEKLEEEELA